MSLFPDFTDQRLRSPALPKRQRFFFLLISFILPLPCAVSVHGQESAPAGEAVAEAGDETAALPSEVLRMSRIREKIRMNSRLIDPFGFSMTSEKKAPEFIIEPEEEQDENEQERPPSGLTSRAVGLLPLTGIYPSKNQIVVRGRPYQAGSSIPIQIEGVMVNLIFLLIEPDGIRFRDADTGEEVLRPVRTRAFILPGKDSSLESPEAKGIFPRSGVIPIQ
jgi:hypothetical protein